MGYNIIGKERTCKVKGERITFLERIKIDEITNEEIYDPKLEQENDVTLYNEYRKVKGLLSSEKIKEIRLKLGVSQVIFAKVLGLGDKTIARYENGSIQDMAPNNLIKAVGEKPIYFLELLKNCIKLKAELTHEDFYILLKEVDKKVSILSSYSLSLNKKDFLFNTSKSYSSIKLAQFILKHYNYEKMKEMISPLKLQKILNYVYSYCLVIFDYKITEENLEAWAHGPVFPSVYQEYSFYKYNGISIPESDVSLENENLEKLILKIAEGYGKFSAKELEHMTHREHPWKYARERAKVSEGERSNESILDSDIKDYFNNLLYL